MIQQNYSPTDYAFEWTKPEPGKTFGWYKWDRQAGTKAALQARNAEAKRLKGLGYLVTKYTMKDQQLTLGGIGTPYPEVNFTVNVYMLSAHEQLTLDRQRPEYLGGRS